MMSHTFAGKTVELGANWIEGTQTGDGPANPIFELAKKHNIRSQFNDGLSSVGTLISTYSLGFLPKYSIPLLLQRRMIVQVKWTTWMFSSNRNTTSRV